MISDAMRKAMLDTVEFNGGYWVTLLNKNCQPMAAAVWISGLEKASAGHWKPNEDLNIVTNTSGFIQWVELRNVHGEFVMRSKLVACVSPGCTVKLMSINVGIE